MNEDDLFFNTMEFPELKKKYELLEVNLHKFEIENSKKNKEIQRLQDELQKYRKLTNDASTDYPWPEEFCDRWKKLFESTIMESFDNIFYTNILLVRVINIIVKIVYDLSKEKIVEKIKNILNCFGVENISENSIKIFFQKFQFSIFQDYFKTIIKIDDILLNKILLNIRLEIGTQKGILFTESEIEEINKDLDSKQMNFFLKELFILSLYMHFHDPLLSIKTSTELNYCYFSKKDFISLDGFGKENSVCLIILSPPVMRFNIYFKKLVPIVFICENPTEDIIKQCELKKFYQLRKTQSKSFNVVNSCLIYNLQNQVDNDDLNTINNEKIENEKDLSQSQTPLNNTHNNSNGMFNISNFTSVTTGTSNPSNRNIQNVNFKNFYNSNSIINNNVNEKNKNINNLNEQSTKKDSKCKSENKTNQNKENNYIKNQEHLFKIKQQQNIKKQINNNTANESTISQNDNSNINQSKQNEKHIFNVINNIKSQNNNIKKDKSFTISATEEINFDDQSPSNILRLKREIELRNIKSKLSIDKIDNHSRNNSTLEFDGNNNSNRVKNNNFENYPIKLVTEIHNGYSPKNNQNYLQTPIQKKRTNSIGSQSEKSMISNEQNIKFINQNLITNQRKIKTTIRKVNNNDNSFLRKNISSIDQNNINEQNIENYSNNEININNNNNNYNNNYNNINNNKGSKNSNNVNNNNKNKEKVDLYKMDVSGNNNFESASYRNSIHNLMRNNSQLNGNKSHDISTNSICSNHGNSKELKSTFPGSSNNFIINNNMNLQNNVINNNFDIYKHKNNINKESLSNIVFNSKKGFDYSNNQPIKTDYDNYVTNNTLEGPPIKNEENSTLNSNRVGNSSNIKNPFFSTNDIKSMKIFNKNEIKKGNKTLIGKKNDNNFGNVDIQQLQNSRIKSPSFKNSINTKNNNNNGFNTKSPKKSFNLNSNSNFTTASNKFLNDKKFHTNNQLNKFKKK